MQMHGEVIITINKYWFPTSVFSLIMLYKSLEAMIFLYAVTFFL